MTQAAAPTGAIRRLLGRLGGVAGALVVGQVLVGLTYVIAARALDPAALGLVATCAAIGTIGATVFDAGLNDLLVREVAGGGLTVPEARAVIRGKRRFLPVLLVPTVVASIAITGSPVEGGLLGLLGVAVWESQTASSQLRAQSRFSRSATGQVGGRALGLGVVLLFVVLDRPEVGLPAALLVAYASEALIDRVFLGRATAPAMPFREARPLWRQGVGYGLTALAASAQQLDTPLVALGGGAAAAGLYAAAGRLLGPLGFLATALSLVAAPWLAEARGNPQRLRAEERRIMRVGAGLCLAPLAVAAVGPVVIPILLGQEYVASGTVFAVLAIGSVLSTANQPLAIIVQNRGRQRDVALAVATGLGLGLVATYGLAAAGGAVWAAVGFLVSQAYIAAHLALLLRRLYSRAAA